MEALHRRNFWIRVAVMMAYTLIIGIGIAFHEPWRDEGQVWLIARDLDFWSLFLQSGAEGHPFVWHFILKPFTWLPYYPTISILNFAFILASIYLILFRTSVPLLISSLMIFSPVMMEYGDVARNYGICLFLLSSCAVLYPKRFQNPILYAFCLGLLSNSIVVSGVIGTGMSIAFWYDSCHIYPTLTEDKKKNLIIGLAISTFFTVLFGLQILFMILVHGKARLPWLEFAQVPHAIAFAVIIYVLLLVAIKYFIIDQKYTMPRFGMTKRFSAIAVLALVVTFIGVGPLDRYSPEWPIGFIDLRVLIVFLTGYLIFFKDMSVLTLSFTGVAMVMISVVFEEGYTEVGLRHITIYIFQSLFFFSEHLNIARRRFVINTVAILIFFATSPIFSLVLFYAETTMKFSGAPQAAQYIREQGWDDKSKYHIVVVDTAISGGVAPYFPENKDLFYFPNVGDYGTFSDWRYRRWKELTNAVESPGKTVIYMEEDLPTLVNPNLYWEPITNFPGVVESVGFYLLKTNQEL
ncbi:MAG: hypothetical protein ACRCY4_10025 [Brevinema sp.]